MREHPRSYGVHARQHPLLAPTLPAKLPLEARANTPDRMEPRERGFVCAGAIHVDMSERLWINANAFTVRERDYYYCVQITRADNGVTIEVPDNIRYSPARKMPFEAVLPVLKIQIVDSEE